MRRESLFYGLKIFNMDNDRLNYFSLYSNELNLVNPHIIGLMTLNRLFVICADIMMNSKNETITLDEFVNNTSIELSCITTISDPEAKEIAMKAYDKGVYKAEFFGTTLKVIFANGQTSNECLYTNHKILDEVRAAGYATDWKQYTVDEMISKKWIILK